MFGVTGLRFSSLSGHTSDLARWWRFGWWGLLWILGHIVGGGFVGAALGWAGSKLPESFRAPAQVALALACLAWGIRQAGWFDFPMPQWRRQVQRGWMKRFPWSLVALGYGVQLGGGIGTFIPVCTTYAALAFAGFSRSAALGGATMALFGFARALAPLLAGPFIASPLGSLQFAATLDSYEPWIWRVNAALLILTGAALLTLHSPLLTILPVK